MKTFQEFQEQMLNSADKNEIKMATMKASEIQRVKEIGRQRRHAEHEREMKNSREDMERMRREKEHRIS